MKEIIKAEEAFISAKRRHEQALINFRVAENEFKYSTEDLHKAKEAVEKLRSRK